MVKQLLSASWTQVLINAVTGKVKSADPQCPVRRVVSMGRRNTFLKFTRRSLKT
jgi:hypothetical protein